MSQWEQWEGWDEPELVTCVGIGRWQEGEGLIGGERLRGREKAVLQGAALVLMNDLCCVFV